MKFRLPNLSFICLRWNFIRLKKVSVASNEASFANFKFHLPRMKLHPRRCSFERKLWILESSEEDRCALGSSATLRLEQSQDGCAQYAEVYYGLYREYVFNNQSVITQGTPEKPCDQRCGNNNPTTVITQGAPEKHCDCLQSLMNYFLLS